MIITPVGYICIIIALVSFLSKRKNKLFWLSISTLPFKAIDVIIVPAITTQITIFQLFGSVYIGKNLLDYLITKKANLHISRTIVLAFVFLLSIFLSSLMPIYLDNKIDIITMETWYGDIVWKSLTFSRLNITQLSFPLFYITFFIVLCKEINTRSQIYKILKLHTILAMIVFVSGLFYQLILSLGQYALLGKYFYFFTGTSSFRELDFTFGVLPRMYSLVGEPGYTNAYFLFVFSLIALISIHNKELNILWTKKINFIILICLTLGIFLAGGTTGIFGLAVFFVLYQILSMLLKNKYHSNRNLTKKIYIKFIIYGCILTLCLIMLFSIVFDMSFISWINSAHLDKLTLKAGDGSGQTRYNLFIEGIKVFLQSPILGVGYGSHRTTSMLSSLLSNIGLVGTILFLLINYQIIKNIIKIIKRTDQFEVFILAYSLLLTLGTSLITYLIGKSMVAITFGWYWMLLAIMEVFYIKIYVKQTYEHSDNTGYIK